MRFERVCGKYRVAPAAVCIGLFTMLGCSTSSNATPVLTSAPVVATKHILFVGDSFTHGRYLPVRTYNNTPGTGGLGSTAASESVVDENFNATDANRMESQNEAGPWGGIPGIFAELAMEAGLPYDVHIEAISGTTLTSNFSIEQKLKDDVITRPIWDSVVLQEATFEPIPPSLSGNPRSTPANFCSAVISIEQAVHLAAPSARVYLYETGAPADTAYSLSNPSGTMSAFSDSAYLKALQQLTDAYHDAYLSAAKKDTFLAGVALTGDAWSRAWSQGVANPDPYGGSAPGKSLTFDYQPGSDPSTVSSPVSAGFHHPSIYGAYLNALVLFQTITGVDVSATFKDKTEQAAHDLKIPPDVAVLLQKVASDSVTMQNNTPTATSLDPCK